MQRELLSQELSELLRVYVVWLPMLWTDARIQWDGNVMPDPRVVHLWDGERVVGAWFAQNVDGFEGVSWDSYYVYGADATWVDVPAPLAGSGATVYSDRNRLRGLVDSLLADTEAP